MSKEIWIDLYDELKDLALSRGMSEKDAEKYAEKNINDRYAETMRDNIDQARTAKKYQDL